jgi:hypothetical protein
MSIVRVGSTQKFSEGWDSIFGGKKTASAVKSAKKAAAKKSGKKKGAGKGKKK